MTAQPSYLAASLSVAAGGAVGAWLRFVAGRLIGANPFPYATLTVNVLGSLAMGLLAGWLARHGESGEPWRLLLGVGVLGGFTTFSSFSLETALMIQKRAYGQAFTYSAASVLLAIAALFAGLLVARKVFA